MAFPAEIMPETTNVPTATAEPRLSRALLIVAVFGGLLLAGTCVLWAHYGTAVFYEVIAAGLAACF
jgi:hypothetical protein